MLTLSERCSTSSQDAEKSVLLIQFWTNTTGACLKILMYLCYPIQCWCLPEIWMKHSYNPVAAVLPMISVLYALPYMVLAGLRNVAWATWKVSSSMGQSQADMNP